MVGKSRRAEGRKGKRMTSLAVVLREWRTEHAWKWRKESGEEETDGLLVVQIRICLSFVAG